MPASSGSDPRLDYFLPAEEHLAAPAVKQPPAPAAVPSLLKLMLDRKAALEESIRTRFREARASGATADVKRLSSTLHDLKLQIAALRASGGQAEAGTCAVCGSDSFLTARWHLDRTICSRCWPKVRAGTGGDGGSGE